MATGKKSEADLHEQIAKLKELIDQTADEKNGHLQLPEKLAVLDTVARALPQLAHLVKAQRELESEEADPAAILRKALEQLEQEWPELHECKERLRKGGKAAG